MTNEDQISSFAELVKGLDEGNGLAQSLFSLILFGVRVPFVNLQRLLLSIAFSKFRYLFKRRPNFVT